MKNYFVFIFKAALDDFAHNKSRTFLTSLGILIGVMSVVLLIAFGLGLKKYISNQFESLGTNLLFVMPGNKDSLMRGGVVGGIKFDDKDVNKIKRIKTITALAPAFAKPGTQISANGKSEYVEVIASNADMIPVFNLEIEEGRLIDKADVEKGGKVILIAPKIADKLFGSTTNALDNTLELNGQNFKVVGIIKSKGGGGIGGSDMDSHVYIPFKASYSFNVDKKYFAIYLKAADNESIEETKDKITETLAKRYDEDEFSVMEQTEILGAINSIFSILNTVLIAIAAISLVVGGIGIMNIMYVTVSERIREIGVRRALGARRNDILFHFLIESVILSLIGGVVGLLLSLLIVLAIHSLFPAYIDLMSVLLALGVSSLIGVIFGVFPAKKAADLSPIEAIRYE